MITLSNFSMECHVEFDPMSKSDNVLSYPNMERSDLRPKGVLPLKLG